MPDDLSRTIRNVMARRDALDQWQRAAIGPSAQLRMPLRDQVDLRRVATILRGLANELEVAGSLRTETDFGALMRAKTAVKMAQARMTSNTG